MDLPDRPDPSAPTTDGAPLITPNEPSVQGAPGTSVGPIHETPTQGASLEEEAPATVIEQPDYTPYVDPTLYRPSRRRRQYLSLGLALIAGIALVLIAQHRPKPTTPVTSIDKQYGKVTVPLDKLPTSTASSASNLAGIVTVNGQLNVQSGLVLGPMTQPATPLPGQLFYNQATNHLSYFDGKQYQSVLASPSPDALTQALSAAQQPSLTAGNGIKLNGNTINNNGVLSFQGSTGAITLNGSNGIDVTGTTLKNTGVLSFGGENGNISLGNGLSISNGTIKNDGVVTVIAGNGLTASDDGNGNVTVSVLPGAGTGNVNTAGGTTGTFALFSDSQAISNSLLTQNGSSITADGNLVVTGNLSLGQALSVGNGGTGANNFTSGGIIIGNGSNAFTALTGVSGQCLIADANGGASYQTCPGGTGNTTPTLQDIYTNSNSSPVITLNGIGKGISIRDNGTPVGGNLLSVANSTGTNVYFAVTTGGVNVTGNLTATGFSGDGAGISNLNASNVASGTINDARLSTNVALKNANNNFTGTLQHNGNNVCDTSGNCVGAAGGGIGGSGTANKVALFTGSGYTIGNSMMSQDVGATTLTVAGALSTTGNISTTGSVTAGNLVGNGSGVTNLNASSLASGTVSDTRLSTNVALQNGANNFTGTLQHNGNNVCDTSGNCGTVGGSGTANKIALFTGTGTTIGNSLLSQDAGATTVTVNGALVATSFSGNGAGLTSLSAANISTGTLNDARLSTNVPLLNGTDNFTGTLQHNGNNVCDTSGNCVGSGASGAIGGSGTLNQIAFFTGSGYTIGNSIISQNVGATAVTVAGNETVTGTITANAFSGNGAAITSLNASSLASGTVSDTRLSTNVSLLNGSNNFTGTLQHNGNNVCDTSGNCVGAAGGGIGGSGTANTIAMFNGSGYTIANSMLSQNAGATLLTVGGNVTTTGSVTAATFSGNGAAVTNVNAAQLNGQAASYYTNASNIGTGTLGDGRLSTNVALLNGTDNFTGVLQHNGNNVCDMSGNCVGTAGGAIGGSGTANKIALFTGTGYTVGNSILSQDVGATTLTITGATSTTGNITTTGSVTAGSFVGDGTSVTNVNAAQLSGQAASYYTNATNLSTGTINTARVSGSYTGITGTGALATGSITSGFGAISTTNNITTSVTLQGGTVTATTGFSLGATAGSSITCSGGQMIQNQVVTGGITTGGTCASGGTGVSTVGALDGGTANAKGATISGTTIYLQSASASFAGLVNTTTQTFAGAKTFSGAATFSAAGTALAVTNNATIGGTLGVTGATSLSSTLTVSGDITANGNINIAGSKTLNVGSALSYNMYGTGSSFAAASSVPVGGGPQGVATGDFNGDGKTDFITANNTSNTVSVLLSNGDGTFQTQKTTTVGTSPYGVAVGDFNGDGKLDAVVTNNGATNATVLTGVGDGTFTTSTIAIGTTPYGVTVADLNGDGKLDIVTANGGASTVSVFLGNGNGTFATKVNYTVGASPYSVATGDFNNDGKLDIITANESASTASVLLGNGDGTFQAKKDTAVGTNPYGMAVGDFNGDGKLDAVTGNYWTGTISIMMGIGDGTFSVQSAAAGTSAEGVTVGDFNGDGKPDVANADYDGIAIRVFINNGTATPFSSGYTSYATPSANPRWIANGDFNGDGKLDIVTAMIPSTNAAVYMNGISLIPTSSSVSITIPSAATGGLALQGASGQTADLVHIQDSSANPLFVIDKSGHLGIGTLAPRYAIDTTGDINTNGAFHVNGNTGITATCSGGQVVQNQVVKGGIITGGSCVTGGSGGVNAIGTLDSGTANATGASIVGGTTLALQSASASFAGLVNTTTQTFAGAKTFSAAGTGLTVTNNASIGGTLTVTGTTTHSDNVTVASGKALGVGSIVGFTTYSAGSSFATKVNYAAGTNPEAVTTADLNGDGKKDVIAANNGTNTVSVFLGNGDGTVAAQVTYPVNSGPQAIATGDFNGDGKTDVVTAGGGSISVLLGNGDGTLQTMTTYTGGGFTYAIRVGDVNGDGKQDLTTVDAFGGTLDVLLGNGNGTFQAQQTFSTTQSYPYSVTLGDFNGDGKLDAAVATFYGYVNVFLGNGNGTFQAAVQYTTSSYAYSITNADFNNDGKLDLAVGGSGGQIYIMQGNGNGTFQGAINYATGSTGSNYNIIAGDFNGDGLTDVATPNDSSNNVSVFIGNGDATFQTQVSYTVGSAPYGITAGDLNGDSKLDLITANNSGNNISVLLNGVSMQNVNAGLSVTTASASSGGIVIQGSASQSADLLHIQDSSGGGLLVVDKSGHLGIGILVPRYAIDVTGDMNVSGVYRVNGTGGTTVTCATGQFLQGQTVKGGITTGGSCLSAAMTSTGHLVVAGSATPTIAAGTAACTTPTVSVSGSDTAGLITVTTGTGCSTSGKLATLTFGNAFGAAPNVVVTPATATAAALQSYVDSSTTSTTKFDLNSGTTPTASTTYRWYYHVIQ